MIWTVKAERMNVAPIPERPEPTRVIVSHEMSGIEAAEWYERARTDPSGGSRSRAGPRQRVAAGKPGSGDR